jgi:hypothetical protein
MRADKARITGDSIYASPFFASTIRIHGAEDMPAKAATSLQGTRRARLLWPQRIVRSNTITPCLSQDQNVIFAKVAGDLAESAWAGCPITKRLLRSGFITGPLRGTTTNLCSMHRYILNTAAGCCMQCSLPVMVRLAVTDRAGYRNSGAGRARNLRVSKNSAFLYWWSEPMLSTKAAREKST